MEVFIGTSGWRYSWNEGNSLDWYVKNSGFNAVELNSSFYHFPPESAIKKWSKYSSLIHWVVKVNRIITHVKKLKDVETWYKFEKIFEPINPDLYLFQFPESFKFNEENLRRILYFEGIVGEKMAVEFRDIKWYQNELPLKKATIVSIDSPIGTFIVKNTDTIYLRFHGRTEWYWYEYSRDELEELARKVIQLNPSRLYIFFNNDLWMLENGRMMKKIIENLSKKP
ncbi:MAG: DUF72 domain-containing protein [Sulfolobus sp.]